jgi:Ca-activated chloride channel family protein
MERSGFFRIAGCIAGILCFACFARADGLIVIDRPIPPRPVPIPAPAPEFLPVKYHRVSVTIDRQVATTTVDQVFRNDKDYDLEGTYIFPIPEDAAVKNFSLYIDGKKVGGEILDRDKARQIYEDIVRRMKDPGLLEYVGRNMFRARIFPIPKHGERRVEISYQQTVPYDAGIFRYSYPLNTEKFSPKPLEEVAVSVKISSDVPIKSVYSPSHEVDAKVEKNSATCGYEEKNVKPDKDFLLYYTVSEKDMGLNVISYRKSGEDGYFMLLLSPGEFGGKAIDKDIVFVLDTSGSMSGDKLKQAKGALRFCLNSLGKGDRFNIVSFATGVSSYAGKISPVQRDNVNDALKFVGDLEARGGLA